jgi:hypothetical protein
MNVQTRNKATLHAEEMAVTLSAAGKGLLCGAFRVCGILKQRLNLLHLQVCIWYFISARARRTNDAI